MIDRRRRLWFVLAAVVVVVVVLALASRLVRSPAQVAADASAPPASTLTAPVERKVVAEALVFRGAVQPEQTTSVIPAGVPEGAEVAVITAFPVAQGATVDNASVLVEVSGRPVILLSGAVPMYRSLSPGMSGADVRQVQAALATAGLGRGKDAEGTYGDGTAAAVGQLYARLGYAAPAGGALPRSETLVASGLPARVSTVAGAVGDPSDKAKMTLSVGRLAITGTLDLGVARLLRPQMPVDVASEILGKEATGTVTAITEAPATASGASKGMAVLMSTSEPLGSEWEGQDVRLTVTTAASAGPVLCVPATSVTMGSDGSARVVVVAADQSRRPVPVRLGVAGGGYLEITPMPGATLAEGERVVVGKAR